MIEIKLTQNQVALIDDIDIEINNIKWFAHKKGKYNIQWYAMRGEYINKKQYQIYMHRVILERILGRKLEKGEQVDHINCDGLDNRRLNLRLATHKDNIHNQRPYKSLKSSQYKGVSWITEKRKWKSQIRINDIPTHLGYFDNEEMARDCYNKKAKELYGEFAYAND
jgi:hypothetical protein